MTLGSIHNFPFFQSLSLYVVCMDELWANPQTCWRRPDSKNAIKLSACQPLKLEHAFQHLNMTQQTSAGWYFMVCIITTTDHPT